MTAGVLADSALFEMTEENREYLGYSRKSDEVLITSISALHQYKDDDTAFPLNRNAGRYFSVNTIALSKYGTIEFRHFATPDNIQEAVANINACLSVKECGLRAWEQAGTEEARYDLETMYHLARTEVETTFGNQHDMMSIEEFLERVDEQKAYNTYSPETEELEAELQQMMEERPEEHEQPDYYENHPETMYHPAGIVLSESTIAELERQAAPRNPVYSEYVRTGVMPPLF
jgi:hypothetical protein